VGQLPAERRQLGWVIAAWVLVQLPFLPTAFRIDEPNILAIARQIAREPLDPYGFTINWNGTTESAFTTLANPPLFPAILAGWAAIAGWSETAMHLAVLPFSVMALLALASLAKIVGLNPALAAFLGACSPALFLGSQVVMPDVSMVALLCAALAAAFRYLESGSRRALFVAILCAFAAPLMKYNAVALVPALGMAAFVARQRRAGLVVVATAPLAALVLWGLVSAAIYGEAHFVAITRMQQAAAIAPWPGALAALGLGVIPLALIPRLLPAIRSRAVAAGVGAVLLFLVLQAAFLLGYPPLPSLLYGISVTVALLFIVAVLGRGVEGWKSKHALLVALAALALTTLALQKGLLFTSVRYLMPLLPAAILLPLAVPTSRPPKWLLALSGMLILALAIGDAASANTYRAVIRNLEPRLAAAERLYFAGHWGFQYYAEIAGGRAVEQGAPPRLEAGDVLLVSRNAFPGIDPSLMGADLRQEHFDLRPRWPLRALDCAAATNFYGNAISGCRYFPLYLPFGFATGAWDRVTLITAHSSPPEEGVTEAAETRTAR
jgi:4-amino-4-deoxy-L-arabinose transferase-like glycosyltransferase